MNLYERYLNGETKEVYVDINKLGSSAFDDPHREEVAKVMVELVSLVGYI